MNQTVEGSLKVMEKSIPEVHGTLNCSIEGKFMVSDVDYVYNPRTGRVLEIWSHGGFDPGKRYHSFNVKTPLDLFSEKKIYEIVDYFPPDGITLEAKQNLEDAVRLWNDKHGY